MAGAYDGMYSFNAVLEALAPHPTPASDVVERVAKHLEQEAFTLEAMVTERRTLAADIRFGAATAAIAVQGGWREALQDARNAIASLPEDALGMAACVVDFHDGREEPYPIRDELLAKIDAALEQQEG